MLSSDVSINSKISANLKKQMLMDIFEAAGDLGSSFLINDSFSNLLCIGNGIMPGLFCNGGQTLGWIQLIAIRWTSRSSTGIHFPAHRWPDWLLPSRWGFPLMAYKQAHLLLFQVLNWDVSVQSKFIFCSRPLDSRAFFPTQTWASLFPMEILAMHTHPKHDFHLLWRRLQRCQHQLSNRQWWVWLTGSLSTTMGLLQYRSTVSLNVLRQGIP